MRLGKQQKPPQRHNHWTQLKPWQRWLLVCVPLAVFCMTAGAIYWATQGIRDRATEWAVIGALFTGGAALVAVLGLPFAIWQLWIVQQEQERIAEQLEKTADIKLGFLEGTEIRDTIAVPLPANWHNRVFTIRAHNAGRLTARSPHLDVTVPWFHVTVLQGNAAGGGAINSRISNSKAALNPGDDLEIAFSVLIEQGTPDQLSVECHFTSEDATPARQRPHHHSRCKWPIVANEIAEGAEAGLRDAA